MKIPSLKRDCLSSPIQHQYTFEKFLNEKGQTYKVAYNYAKSFEQMKKDNVGFLFYGDIRSGKTMYLIVDHSLNQDNVRLFTEVGEQDLLNMIESEDKNTIKVEEPKKEEIKNISGIGEKIFEKLRDKISINWKYQGYMIYLKYSRNFMEEVYMKDV